MSEQKNSLPELDLPELFQKKSPPKKHLPGQLWTVFPPANAEESSPGQIVMILSSDADTALVVPIHAHEEVRAILDPILPEAMHDALPVSMVAAVHLTMIIDGKAFEEARYLGEVKEEGRDIVNHQYHEFLRAMHALSWVQRKDSQQEPLSEDEEKTAANEGIYRLCPVNGDVDALAALNKEIHALLDPWHLLAVNKRILQPAENTFLKVSRDLIVRIKNVGRDWEPVPIILSGAGDKEDLPSSIPFVIDGIGNISITFRKVGDKITMVLEGEHTDEALLRKPVITLFYGDGHQETHLFSRDYISKDIPLRESNIVRIDLEFTKDPE